MDNIKTSSDKEKSSTCIECECGSKINLSCDPNQMGNSIAAHAHEHAQTKPDIASAKAEASRIEDLLTGKVFTAINLR